MITTHIHNLLVNVIISNIKHSRIKVVSLCLWISPLRQAVARTFQHCRSPCRQNHPWTDNSFREHHHQLWTVLLDHKIDRECHRIPTTGLHWNNLKILKCEESIPFTLDAKTLDYTTSKLFKFSLSRYMYQAILKVLSVLMSRVFVALYLNKYLFYCVVVYTDR